MTAIKDPQLIGIQIVRDREVFSPKSDICIILPPHFSQSSEFTTEISSESEVVGNCSKRVFYGHGIDIVHKNSQFLHA